MRYKGRLQSLTFDRTGGQILTLALDGDFREAYDELADIPVSLELKKYREKRSKNANDLLWALCTEIGKNQHVTPEEVYRKEIREAGVCEEMVCKTSAYAKISEIWSERGIGWFTVKTDEASGWTYFLQYYGSSSYDTAEMSRVINNTITDAKALGIEVASPSEISLLLEEWRK